MMKKLILTSSMLVLLCAGYFQSKASEKPLAMEVANPDCEIQAQAAYNYAFQYSYTRHQNLAMANFEGILAYDAAYGLCVELAREDG